MKKSKVIKCFLNGGIMVIMAALGITIYQIGTTSIKDKNELIEMQENIYESDVVKENQYEDYDEESKDVQLDKSEEELDFEETGAQAKAELPSEEMDDLEAGIDVDGELTDVVTAAEGIDVMSFSEDTLMEWPVHGNILIDYSMNQTVYFPTLDQYRLSPAISIQAVESAPVVAAVNGEVYSIDNSAKTGTTVTMELGNGYQAIYGQLKDLAVDEGQIVEKGTIIGYVDVPTKYYSLEGSNLYFAMKKDGKPVDPILFLP